MSVETGKNVIICGNVSIGRGSVVEDHVIIGTSEEESVIIGNHALIRSGSIIYSGVRTGDNFKTGHHVLIRENTEIGDDVLIGTNSVIDGNCRIGSHVRVQTNVYITAYTVIEDNVFIGPCAVTTNDRYMEYLPGKVLKGPVIKKGARIGANSTILPGLTIAENTLVGAGAVVTRDTKENEVLAGNPAVSMRTKQKQVLKDLSGK